MPYCGHCGKEVNSYDKFCGNCGEKVNLKKYETKEYGTDSLSKTIETYDRVTETEDYTWQFDSDDIEKNKGFALFAYLGAFILVPIFEGKNSKFARYHIGQGVNLMIAFFVYSVVQALILALFSWLPGGFHNGVWAIFDIMEALGVILLIILKGVGIHNTRNGIAKDLPLVGRFRIIKY